MLLQLLGTSLDRPKRAVVILRSLRQASKPGYDDDKSWWVFLNDSVDAVFLFSPNVDSFLGAYISGPQGGLPDAATGLLQELSTKPWINTCSIIFFAHSFGGLILKKATILAYDHPDFRQVIDSTVGVIFFGTPHDGNDPNFNKAIKVGAGAELECNYRSNMLRQLVSDQSLSEMRHLCNQFRSLRPNLSYNICSFYEERETPYKARFSNKQMLVISLLLARLQLAKDGLSCSHETAIGLDLDHASLSSYNALDQRLKDQLHEIVSKFLSRTTHQSLQPTTSTGSEILLHQESSHNVLEVFRTAATRPEFPLHKTVPSSSYSSSGSVRLPCHVINPYQRNPAFMGRSDILSTIDSALTPLTGTKLRQEQRKFALVGMGGIGKTQIAVEYAFRSLQKFPIILWAHAETRAKLSQSYSEFEQALGLSSIATQNENESRKRMRNWLATTNINWLLVFDNVEDKTDQDEESPLTDFWPSGDRGSILVTARNEASLGQFTGGEIKNLAKLTDDDGIHLLLKLSGRPNNETNREDAKSICYRIDYLPLAISSVAALLKSTKLGLDDYLAEYTNSDLIRKSKPLSGPEAHYLFSLATAWQSQFTHLDNDSPGSRSFLNILALLDPDGIREKFLLEGVQKTRHPKLRLLNIRKFRESLTVMDLIYRNADMKKIWMHRLMQGICHVTMADTNTYQVAFDCAFDLINTIWPVPERHNRQNSSFWPVQQELVPHVESLAEHYRELEQRDEAGEPNSLIHFSLAPPQAFAELLYNAGWYLYERGNFRSSFVLLDTAERYCLTHPDRVEAILADINGAYASIDSESNDMEACQMHFELQLRYCLEAIEKGQIQRPNVREALAYGGMGHAKMIQNRYHEAEQNYRRCVEIWKECPGEPTIYLKHLATALTVQGCTDEAEQLLKEVIEERAKKFGPKDTTSYRTGTLYNALGNNQVCQGRFDVAYETHLDALEMIQVSCGEGHHLAADACYRIGWHLLRRGEFEKAEKKLVEALSIYEKEEDTYRNEKARTCFLLGELFRSMGNSGKGDEWNEKAETLRSKILGQRNLPPAKEDDFNRLVIFWTR